MIVLISGASHTGKTLLAQRLIEKYGFPCLSEDLLKMGLIRSGNTDLTPMSEDSRLTEYLWPIVSEMIKTAVENKQNLIVEGCYIPYDWRASFTQEYAEHIRCVFLVMSEDYIRTYFDDIMTHANVVEQRLDDSWCTPEQLIRDNSAILNECRKAGQEYILIDKEYRVDIDL